MKTRRLTSLFASTALVAAGLTAASLAAAAPAQAYANCTWIAAYDVQVRENPSINSVVLKTKPAGSAMVSHTDFCATGVGSDGRRWVAVETEAASDKIGYVIADKVYLTKSA